MIRLAVGDVVVSGERISPLPHITEEREWLVEDASYYGASSDNYGDYLPPRDEYRLRLLRKDGTYSSTQPDRRGILSNSSFYGNALPKDLKVVRKMEKTFV